MIIEILAGVFWLISVLAVFFIMKKKASLMKKALQKDHDITLEANAKAAEDIRVLKTEVKKWQGFVQLGDDIFTEVKGKLKCEADIPGALEQIDVRWRDINIECNK